MQGFSRVLTVLIAAVAVAFMGFAGVVSVGGPNWRAKADSLEGYTFSRLEGESPMWSATRSAGRVELATKSGVLPEVYVAAIQDRTKTASDELTVLTDAEPQLETQIKTYEELQNADVPALDRYYEAQRQRLDATYKQIETTGKQQDALAGEVKKLEDQLDSRRQDVYQLGLQYRILQGDVERITQNIQAVEEQIRLLEDELDKAQRRDKALTAQGL
jgi:predicted  nucleic acid-binding Zn-ribbon protein